MNYTLFQTKNGNWYFFSYYQRQTLPCHLILKYILENVGKNSEVVKELRETDTITIDGRTFSKAEINHYCDKYEYLSEMHFFDKITTDTIFNNAINENGVYRHLDNCNVICLELTENCNLKCKYCVYGDNYVFHEDRIGIHMPFETAKAIIDYMFGIWKKNKNVSYQRKYLGFYGGEPLLRFEQIKDIVSYFKKKAAEIHIDTGFLITTNGVLLDKHIDYLYDNKFSLLISLDGDRNANQHRVFPNGLPSFNVVSDNIELIRCKYPEYYKEDVSFSVVLHDKNEESSVRKFFDENYDKTPIVSVLRDSDTNNSKQFQPQINNQPYNYEESFDMERFLNTGEAQAILKFINYYGRNVADDYGIYDFVSLNDLPRHPTGVCFPFAKKIFVTAQGNILPCERINFKYSLGKIEDNTVFLDLAKVSETYNKHFQKCKNTCSRCWNFLNCGRCMFNDVIHNEGIYCPSIMNAEAHSSYLSFVWSVFESIPQVYHQVKSKLNYE